MESPRSDNLHYLWGLALAGAGGLPPYLANSACNSRQSRIMHNEK